MSDDRLYRQLLEGVRLGILTPEAARAFLYPRAEPLRGGPSADVRPTSMEGQSQRMRSASAPLNRYSELPWFFGAESIPLADRQFAEEARAAGGAEQLQPIDPLRVGRAPAPQIPPDLGRASDALSDLRRSDEYATGKYRVPPGWALPDVYASPEQIAAAVNRVQSLPSKTKGWEWATTRLDDAWGDWTTKKSDTRSGIDRRGDVSIHYHPGPGNEQYYPGPGDHAPAAQYGKSAFILTPDRNTLLEVGIRDHEYYVRPVWQRPGTKPVIKDYSKWRPTGQD